MSTFTGKLLMPDRIKIGVNVVVDVETDTLSIKAGEHVIGVWPRSEVGIRGEDDGFHLRMEGEEVVLVISNEADFALAVGMRAASPIMRRRISRGLDEQS